MIGSAPPFGDKINNPNNLLNDYEKHTTHMREYYRDTIGQLLRAGSGSVSDNTSV